MAAGDIGEEFFREDAYTRPVGEAPFEGDNASENPYWGINGEDNRDWANVYKPTAYYYGGRRGMAEQEQARYQGIAQLANTRRAPQFGETTYGRNYAGDRGYDLASRGNQQYGLGQQQYALSQLQGTIEGRNLSVAQAQQNMGLAQAMQQQASIAASARGGGANLAAAQQTAAQQAASLSGNAYQQGALLRAQEQSNAINAYGTQAAAYGGAASAMRGQDLQRAGLSAQLAAQQSSIEMQNRASNDARNLAYEQMRRGVFQDQMGAQQAGEAANAGVYASNADRDQRQRQADQAAATQMGGGTIAAMAAAASDVRFKENIQPAGATMDRTLDGMGSYQYMYKDPQRHGGGQQAGTMAQDLAATPLGKSAVAQGPDGLYVKAPQATNLALSGLARLNERLRAVETQVGTWRGEPGTSYPTDTRNIEAEMGQARAAMQPHYGYTETRPTPVSAGVFGSAPDQAVADQVNARKYADYLASISAERRPVTAGEYEFIKTLPSTPEVELFRQRPEFRGYGNVEGYAEPLPALEQAPARSQPRGVAAATPSPKRSR